MAQEPSPTPSFKSSAKLIQLTSRTNLDWSGKLVDDSYIETLVQGEDTRVLKPDGSLLIHLRKNVLTKEKIFSAWSEVERMNFTSSNRGTAYGIKARPRILKDGSISNTTEVPKEHKVMSFIIGYMDRNPRTPFCRACAWNQRHPERWAKIVPLAQEVSQLFEQTVPDRFGVQKEFCSRVHPDFVIPGTAFTTITINKNFRTACHLDAGDLEAGFGTIILLRKGKFKGGTLVMPDFKVGVNFDTGDALFFDVHEYHGNTRIYDTTQDFQRCTMVFYARSEMVHCKSALEEAEFAKSRKLGDPLS